MQLLRLQNQKHFNFPSYKSIHMAIKQTPVKLYQSKIKSLSSSSSKINKANQKFGDFDIIAQVNHLDIKNNENLYFSDYLFAQNIKKVKSLKRTEFSEQYFQQPSKSKQRIYFCCQVDHSQVNKPCIDFDELKKLFESINYTEQNKNKPQNIIFPQSFRQVIVNNSCQKFLCFNISGIRSILRNLRSFLPIKNLSYSTKFQSQLYCLNIFYRFLLIIGKPLFKFIDEVSQKYEHLGKIIQRFFLDCLVIQNIFFQESTNQFYLFCNHNRVKVEPQKQQQKQQRDINQNIKSNQNNKTKILKRISSIFWKLFFPLSKIQPNTKESTHLHISFLRNFISSIAIAQLTFQQTLQILESKQKRKKFISQKINISTIKSKKQSHIFTEKRKISFEKINFKTFDVNKNPNQQNENQFIDSNYHYKQKSVKRRLKEKRNTIDVMFQNYFTNTEVPPSFFNRSVEKKGRLFRHDKSVSKSKSGDKSFRKYFDRSQNGKIQDYSLKHSSTFKKKSVSSYDPQQKNYRYHELSDRLTNQEVSKTIEISQIDLLKKRLKEKAVFKSNQTTNFQKQSIIKSQTKQKNQFSNFNKTNLKSSKIFLNSSTQNIQTKNQTLSIKQNFINDDKFVNLKQNLFKKNDTTPTKITTQVNSSKKSNRRYHYQPKNTSQNIMNNQSIKRLIEDQLEIYKTIQNQKSRQKYILKKSQQKALSFFNNQFNSKSNNIEDQKSLSISKSKQNQGIMSKNLPNLLKRSNDKNIFEQQKNLKNSFSPPKSKKKSHTQGLRYQFSPNLTRDQIVQKRQLQIDSRNLKSRILSYFSTGVREMNQNYGIKPPNSVRQILNSTAEIYKVNNEHLQQKVNSNQLNQKISLIEKNGSKKEKLISQNQIIKVENQFLYSAQKDKNNNQINLINEDQIQSRNIQKSQKCKINQTKKEKNKKPIQNIQQIFCQQQAIAQAQEQLRKMPQQENTETNLNQLRNDNNSKSFYMKKDKANQQNIQPLQQLQSIISPIKHMDGLNIQMSSFQLQRRNSFQEPSNRQKEKKNGNAKQINGKKESKDTRIQNQMNKNQLIKHKKNLEIDNSQNTTINQVDDRLDKKSFNDMTKQIIESDIEEGKIIQRQQKNIPIIDKQLSKEQPHSISQNDKNQNTVTKDFTAQINHPKIIESSNKINPIKDTKKQKQPKKATSIAYDQQIQLEQIKLAPPKNTKNNSITEPKLTNNEKTIQIQSEKSQRSTKDKKDALNTKKEQTETENKAISTINQPPLPSKTNHQSNKSLNIQTSSKKGKQSNRQHTSKSSQGTSYGPYKPVKKIVQEYVFFVNRMGQTVAKSTNVSKKVEKVCDWYVGVYFMYKRFFHERKKIEKYLKQGTPLLTRYKQQINKDEWLTYLKSKDREQLLKKVSEQNIKITQSIQKMQHKLMTKKIPQEIKRFSAISERSNQQSFIVIQKIIDEFDILLQNKMLEDQEILIHCTSLLNACRVIAELDQMVQEILPIRELIEQKKTVKQLEDIAQQIFRLYFGQEQSQLQQQEQDLTDQ